MANDTPETQAGSIPEGSPDRQTKEPKLFSEAPAEHELLEELPEEHKILEEKPFRKDEVWAEIYRGDAEFRRKFASNMLGLVAATVCMSFAALLIASYATIASPENATAASIVATTKEIFPVAFSGVMGVFGTIVGFYFAKGDSN